VVGKPQARQDRMDAAQAGRALGLDAFWTYLELLKTAFPSQGEGKHEVSVAEQIHNRRAQPKGKNQRTFYCTL